MAPKNTQKQPDTDQEILNTTLLKYHQEGMSTRQIGKLIGKSGAFVSVRLRQLGADLDRTQTKEATQARLALLNARRLKLAEDSLDDASHLRERLFDGYTLHLQGKEGVVGVDLDEPPLKEQLDAAKAIESLINTSNKLTDGIADPALSDAKSVIQSIVDGLAQLVNNPEPDEDTGETPEDKDHDYDITTDPDEKPNSPGDGDEYEYYQYDDDGNVVLVAKPENQEDIVEGH